MALIGSLNSGISALQAFTKGLEVIGNDVANVNSVAYKSARVDYADSFSQFLKRPTTSPASGNGSNGDASQIGMGTQISKVQTSFLQGSLSTTGLPTDLAVSGQGFFEVRDPATGQLFATRAGNFRVDDQGYLVTTDGYRVQGLYDGTASYVATNNGGTSPVYTQTATSPSTVGDIKITYNPTVGSGLTNNTGGAFTDAQVEDQAPKMQSYAIQDNGDINISLTNGESFTLGRVLLTNFQDPNALTAQGNSLFTGFDAAGVKGGATLTSANNTAGTNGLGVIKQGTLELSNVDLTQEFANMITTERSFQAGSKIITTSDQILQEVVNLKQ